VKQLRLSNDGRLITRAMQVSATPIFR
jgi:hypothetical protein